MSLAPNTINVGSFKALPEASPRLGRQSALVVDDSSTILHMICTLLEHHKVVEVVGRAENGLEAIDAVASLNPEIVLIDAELPEMSGLRTALVLSQMCPATRIVLMTMDPSPQFREACAGCGAHAVIYKPRFLKELSAVLWNGPAPHKPAA
jgi:DNA-binding NarL/FixJ family response regulator